MTVHSICMIKKPGKLLPIFDVIRMFHYYRCIHIGIYDTGKKSVWQYVSEAISQIRQLVNFYSKQTCLM